MRKESEIIETKNQFVEKVSEQLSERLFLELEGAIEQGEKEYWENSFIKVSTENIVNLVKEIFKENDGENMLVECPKISENIWSNAIVKVEQRLYDYEFVLGFNTDGCLVIGKIDKGLTPIENPLNIRSDLNEKDSIDELGFPNWICSRLKQGGVTIIGNLIESVEKGETQKMRGIGKKTEQRIKKKLREEGFKIS